MVCRLRNVWMCVHRQHCSLGITTPTNLLYMRVHTGRFAANASPTRFVGHRWPWLLPMSHSINKFREIYGGGCFVGCLRFFQIHGYWISAQSSVRIWWCGRHKGRLILPSKCLKVKTSWVHSWAFVFFNMLRIRCYVKRRWLSNMPPLIPVVLHLHKDPRMCFVKADKYAVLISAMTNVQASSNHTCSSRFKQAPCDKSFDQGIWWTHVCLRGSCWTVPRIQRWLVC